MYGTSTDNFVPAAPSVRRGPAPGLVADEEWPTTQRFSRRTGEAFRGADYAAAVELPTGSSARDATIAIVTVVAALLGAVATMLWRG
jgi:hypothetical protein